MPRVVRIHFDNCQNLTDPHVWIWHPGSSLAIEQSAHPERDEFGVVFDGLDAVGQPALPRKGPTSRTC